MYYRNFLSGIVFAHKKNPYLLDLCSSSIGNYKKEFVTGDNSNKSLIKTIIPAIGEYIERDNISYGKIFDNEKIYYYNLLDNKNYIIPTNYLLNNNILTDSCGLASHTNSKYCIENSLDEFFERQFFIFNYLSKSSGEHIEYKIIKNYLETDYSSYNFFNISIIRGYYTIIAYGIFQGEFIIGLGSSINFKIALLKCVKELNQFQTYYDKNSDKNENIKKTSLDYMDYFLLFNADELSKAYSYLYDSKKIFSKSMLNEKQYTYYEIIKEAWNKYGIDVILFYISQQIPGTYFKETKIASLNWFPTLNPRLYTEKIYKYIENKTGKKLDRNCNFIPFP